jgi:type IV secretory pathway VirB2 component (pilin)
MYKKSGPFEVNRRILQGATGGILLGIFQPVAYAYYSYMPWEGPICAVASSLKGQIAVILSVVATIIIGIMFMYSETGGIVSRIASWLLGMSCALSVASIITALFPGVMMPGCL